MKRSVVITWLLSVSAFALWVWAHVDDAPEAVGKVTDACLATLSMNKRGTAGAKRVVGSIPAPRAP